MSQATQLQELIAMLKKEFGDSRTCTILTNCLQITVPLLPEASAASDTGLQVRLQGADVLGQQSL